MPPKFVHAVAKRTGLSRSDAARITRAVVAALGRRLPDGTRSSPELHELVEAVRAVTGAPLDLALGWVAAVGMTVAERLDPVTLAALHETLPSSVAYLLRPPPRSKPGS